ncbi:MAG TPA: hypothetical protein VFS20_28230, partial [Longimicrobium sp.]|nr:hypothetical protein [Longimicrobium sp.]
ALSDDHAALLVRPNDAALPDLRVVVGLGTETVTPDSAAIEPTAILPTDSVRVEGRVDQGFVVAARVTVLRPGATASLIPEPAADPSVVETGSGPSSASNDDDAPARAVSAPVGVTRAIRGRGGDAPGRGGGQARGRGGGKGGGRGGGRKG